MAQRLPNIEGFIFSPWTIASEGFLTAHVVVVY